MADEAKETQSCKEGNKMLNTVLKVLLGLVLLGLGIWAIVYWLYEIKILIKGCIGPFLVLAALITFAIAKE